MDRWKMKQSIIPFKPEMKKILELFCIIHHSYLWFVSIAQPIELLMHQHWLYSSVASSALQWFKVENIFVTFKMMWKWICLKFMFSTMSRTKHQASNPRGKLSRKKVNLTFKSKKMNSLLTWTSKKLSVVGKQRKSQKRFHAQINIQVLSVNGSWKFDWITEKYSNLVDNHAMKRVQLWHELNLGKAKIVLIKPNLLLTKFEKLHSTTSYLCKFSLSVIQQKLSFHFRFWITQLPNYSDQLHPNPPPKNLSHSPS
jgi:hypothetical protein